MVSTPGQECRLWLAQPATPPCPSSALPLPTPEAKPHSQLPSLTKGAMEVSWSSPPDCTSSKRPSESRAKLPPPPPGAVPLFACSGSQAHQGPHTPRLFHTGCCQPDLPQLGAPHTQASSRRPPSPHLARLARVLDAVEHGAQLSQPLAIHRRDALHVLLQAEALGERGCRHRGGGQGPHQPPLSHTLSHLGGHHKLVVDNVVGCVAHPEQRAGGVQVAGHPRADVHVLADALRGRGG